MSLSSLLIVHDRAVMKEKPCLKGGVSHAHAVIQGHQRSRDIMQ